MSVSLRSNPYIFHISVYIPRQGLVVHHGMSFRLSMVSKVYQVACVLILNGSGFCDELEGLTLS